MRRKMMSDCKHMFDETGYCPKCRGCAEDALDDALARIAELEELLTKQAAYRLSLEFSLTATGTQIDRGILDNVSLVQIGEIEDTPQFSDDALAELDGTQESEV